MYKEHKAHVHVYMCFNYNLLKQVSYYVSAKQTVFSLSQMMCVGQFTGSVRLYTSSATVVSRDDTAHF